MAVRALSMWQARSGYCSVMTANSKRTVLVTGPDPRLRAEGCQQLEAEGFDVVEAESDEEAWERSWAGSSGSSWRSGS